MYRRPSVAGSNYWSTEAIASRSSNEPLVYNSSNNNASRSTAIYSNEDDGPVVARKRTRNLPSGDGHVRVRVYSLVRRSAEAPWVHEHRVEPVSVLRAKSRLSDTQGQLKSLTLMLHASRCMCRGEATNSHSEAFANDHNYFSRLTCRLNGCEHGRRMLCHFTYCKRANCDLCDKYGSLIRHWNECGGAASCPLNCSTLRSQFGNVKL